MKPSMESTPHPSRRPALSAGPAAGEDTGSRMALLLMMLLLVAHMLGEETGVGSGHERHERDSGGKGREGFTKEMTTLTGFNCEEGVTKVLKMPAHSDCTETEGKIGAQPVWEGSFAIVQGRRTQDTKVTTCELVQSEFVGHCGFLSHYSFSKIPDIEAPRYMSLDECRMAHLQGKVMMGGIFHSVEPGLNVIKMVAKGSLVYDPQSQSVSCTDEAGREGTEGQMHLKSELKMVIYQITLSSAPARLRTDTERMVISAGSHEGLELSPLEVRAGGRSLEHVTVLVDGDLQMNHCPYSVIREKVHLQQFRLFGREEMKGSGGLGNPIHSRAGVRDEELVGVALVGDSVAVRLQERAVLTKPCQGLSGSGEVYWTSHQDVLAVRLDGTDHLEMLKGNRQHLNELQEDLVTASRLDLMAFHVSEAFKNLTVEVDKGGCLQNLNDLGSLLDADPKFKSRALPAGEAIILSQCKHVVVEPHWRGNRTADSLCPKFLPVKITGDKGDTQRYLEPRTRFLYKASPTQDCALSHLVPTFLETLQGGYVSFNGSKFKQQDVSEYNWAAKLRYFREPGLDFWEDMSTLGLLNKEEVDNLEIFQQYSVYLTRGAEVQDRDSGQGRSSSGAGSGTMQSWISEMRSRMGLDEASVLDEGARLGGWYSTWKGIKDAWDEVKETMVFWGTVGGLAYSVRVLAGGCFRLVRAVCRTRSSEELRKETGTADGWGCGGDPVGRAACIVCTEVFMGDEYRKKMETRKMVKELIEEGVYETKAHLRDLVLSDGRRRGSRNVSRENLELSPLLHKI